MQTVLARQPQLACRRGPALGTARRARVASPPAAAKKGFGSAGKQQQQQQQQQQVVDPAPSAPAVAAAEQQQQVAPSPEQPPAAAAAPPAAAAADKEDEIEALLRRRKGRKARVEPKVKVESAVVDMATGKAPANAIGQAETAVLQALAGFFGILLVEGLLLAGSGFLPAAGDAFVQDYLYPSYSPQMLLFLGMSSAYGLWKTGKLPGQGQLKQ